MTKLRFAIYREMLPSNSSFWRVCKFVCQWYDGERDYPLYELKSSGKYGQSRDFVVRRLKLGEI